MSLNNAQKRNVSVTMVLVDQALNLCERLIKQGGEQGLLYTIEDDLSALQVDQDEYVVKLIRALRHPEPTTVVRAAAILGCLRDRRAVQPLLALIASSRDPYIQESAMEALGNIGDWTAIEGLSDALAHSYVRVRGKAAEALGKLQDSRARAALISALNDPSAHVRTLAAEALAKHRHNEPVTQQP